jgi:predicted transcriptional regulator of viral defense system
METFSERIASKGGVISTKDLEGRAEYERLRRAVSKGDIVRLRHGVYAEPSAMLNTMIDVERIVPGGIVCLYSAWMHHRLCTTVPPAFCIAIEAKRKVVLPEELPINLYYWKKENLEFGIEQKEISGFQVRMTDLERSVCDAVKYRNKVGVDVCAEVIRSYARLKERNLSRLSEYAQKLRLTKVMNNYLEIAIG